MREFVAIDPMEEEQEFVHANPNVIANLGISKNYGTDSSVFPFLVETYLINHEVIEYKFKTKPEAKSFVRKLGGLEK